MLLWASMLSRISCALLAALATVTCGRIGYDPPGLVDDSGAMSDDADVDAASTSLVNDDPDVVLAPGWNLAIEFDLSSSYTYVNEDFLDGTWTNNRPADLALVLAPFPEGFAVATGRSLLHVDAASSIVTPHDYTPGGADNLGPDRLGSLVFAAAGVEAAPEALLMGGTASNNGGDGVFAITKDWSLSRLNSQNNVSMLAVDPVGVVPGFAEPSLYMGWQDASVAGSGLRSLGDVQEVDVRVSDGIVLADGRFLVLEIDDDPFVRTRLSLVDNWTLGGLTPFVDEDRQLAKGDARPFGVNAIVVSSTLSALTAWHLDGSWQSIANQSTEDWVWVAAEVTPPGVLGLNEASIFMLRHTGDYSELQILRLWRSP